MEPSLLLGNIDGVGQKIHSTINFQIIYENFKIANKLCGFYIMHYMVMVMVVLDLDVIKNIFIKDFNNFVDRGVHSYAEVDLLLAYLFALEGEKMEKSSK